MKVVTLVAMKIVGRTAGLPDHGGIYTHPEGGNAEESIRQHGESVQKQGGKQ